MNFLQLKKEEKKDIFLYLSEVIGDIPKQKIISS